MKLIHGKKNTICDVIVLMFIVRKCMKKNDASKKYSVKTTETAAK
jgi:hypothetical protein